MDKLGTSIPVSPLAVKYLKSPRTQHLNLLASGDAQKLFRLAYLAVLRLMEALPDDHYPHLKLNNGTLPTYTSL